MPSDSKRIGISAQNIVSLAFSTIPLQMGLTSQLVFIFSCPWRLCTLPLTGGQTSALFRALLPDEYVGLAEGGTIGLKVLLPIGKEEGNPRVYFLFGPSDSDCAQPALTFVKLCSTYRRPQVSFSLCLTKGVSIVDVPFWN